MSKVTKSILDEDDLLSDTGVKADTGYAVFKDAKVKQGLKEAQNRSQMVPAEKVWEKLGLER